MAAYLVGYISKADLQLKHVRVCSFKAMDLTADHSRWILVDVLAWPYGASFGESRKLMIDFMAGNLMYDWVAGLPEQLPL